VNPENWTVESESIGPGKGGYRRIAPWPGIGARAVCAGTDSPPRANYSIANREPQGGVNPLRHSATANRILSCIDVPGFRSPPFRVLTVQSISSRVDNFCGRQKLFDENGEPLYVQGSAKGQRRYRYYVSKGLVNGRADQSETGWRISAPQLEQTIAAAAAAILDDRAGIALAFEASNRDEQPPAVLKSAESWAERYGPPPKRPPCWRS
jgi:hypothetical protein